jgi:hypothetical protein
MSCLVLADDEFRQAVQIAKTEHVDFPPGGTVRLKNSTGELTIEAWDQAGVEITTVKSTKAAYTPAEREKASHNLDKVKITTERRGGELVITTDFPRHREFPPPSPFGRATNFNLEYHIKVPRDARLVVDHDVGDVHFDAVTGDIHANALQGSITLHLPEEGQYAIDAKSDIGSVNSDFPGSAKRRFWLVGHQFMRTSQAPHKLYLRAGFGDIIILKIRKPRTPPPLESISRTPPDE